MNYKFLLMFVGCVEIFLILDDLAQRPTLRQPFKYVKLLIKTKTPNNKLRTVKKDCVD